MMIISKENQEVAIYDLNNSDKIESEIKMINLKLKTNHCYY
jgi:hypothetical protein